MNANPKSKQDAIDNLYSFSEEGRSYQHEQPTTTIPSSQPRFRECYGWLTISGRDLYALPRRLHPPDAFIDRRKLSLSYEEYYAILYEYVPDGPIDYGLMQSQLNLLWLAGFCVVTPYEDNWVGGLLIDLADLFYPWHSNWIDRRYKKHNAEDIFLSPK